MTAIAGVVEKGKVYIGGDSAGVGGYSLSVRSDPKVFINGEFIFGYTSSFRMGQLLQYSFSPPKPFENQSKMEYMITSFVPAIKDVFKKNGFQSMENGVESGGTFLLGYRGELFEIEDDYQVARLNQPYYACGCGMDLVLGSLHATNHFSNITPEERIEMALDAAAEFSAGVRGPHTILSI